MVMSAPRVEPFEPPSVTVQIEGDRSAPAPGTRACTAPPEALTQLLSVLPLEAAQTLVAPVRPPFQ